MPKHGRIGDTLTFLANATVLPATADRLRIPVVDWLDELVISPVIDQGMSQGTAGTETSRKYRRAMILILCALNNVPVPKAQQVVAQYADANLPSALGTMLLDVEKVALPRRLNPALHQLRTAPLAFLTNNRIKTGSGALVASGLSPYEMVWDSARKFYLFEPPTPFHTNMHMVIQGGYNIATTKFSTIGNLAQITGSVVQGTIGFTTQLSGCSILYSVNGGNLVVAHVWPNDGSVKVGIPPVLAAHAGDPGGVVLALRMAHQGGLNNALVGGTFGIYGMVNSVPETALRLVGPNNVRTHGYTASLGNAYFIAVKVNGNWQLFGQQNSPAVPLGGVSGIEQIYP